LVTLLQMCPNIVELELDILKTIPYSTFFVLLLAVALNFAVSLVNRRYTNIEEQKRWSIKNAEVRKELMKAMSSGNRRMTEKLQKEQTDLMKEQSKISMQRLKLQLFFFIPFIAVWQLFGSFYGSTIVALMPFDAPFVGTQMNIFWWYFFSSISSNILISRLLGLTFEI